MTTISIRPLQGEEYIDVLFNFQMYAFRASPPFMEKDGWANILRQRQGVTYHVLFEDDIPVAAAANTAMTQNVRGKLYPAGGVWAGVDGAIDGRHQSATYRRWAAWESWSFTRAP